MRILLLVLMIGFISCENRAKKESHKEKKTSSAEVQVSKKKIYVTIPNASLKRHLVNNHAINTNGDSEIQISEAARFTGQIIFDGGGWIQDLRGIEAFINLTYLSVNWCTTEGSLDLSNFTNLEYLDCSKNDLEYINVSNLPALNYLDCSENQITELYVSNLPALNYLDCSENRIKSLDLSNNRALSYINCSTNSLYSLNVSNNPLLTEEECIICDNNSIKCVEGVEHDYFESQELNIPYVLCVWCPEPCDISY